MAAHLPDLTTKPHASPDLGQRRATQMREPVLCKTRQCERRNIGPLQRLSSDRLLQRRVPAGALETAQDGVQGDDQEVANRDRVDAWAWRR